MVSAKCQSEFPELTSKVEGDAERSAELVVPCVPLADRGVRVVDAEAIPRLRNFCETCETSGLNSALDERGTMRHLIGATVGGRDRTARLTSSARAQYECSRSE